MKSQRIRPSELLKLRKETGQSYWDLVGNPLPTFNDGSDDVEALSPHPYTMKSIEQLQPFERFGDGKSQSFAAKLGPLVYQGLRKRGYNNSVAYDNAMRQLALESATGTSRLARQQHNYGGYGYDGKGHYTTFKNDQAFVDAYLDLLTKRYTSALKAKDTASFARELYKKGYYRDSNLAPEQNIRQYANALAGLRGVSKAAAQYWKPFNEVTLDALTEEPDATRVIQVNRLKQPTQTYNDVILPLEDTSTNDNIKVPFKPSTQLPNLIDVYNNMFDMDLPTMNRGKDSGIHIKPSHRGRFTRYLKNHPGMTAEKAKHSKNASVRRMATFAINSRKWRN